MPEVRGTRGARRLLLATATAVVLGAAGTGAAFALGDGPEPPESGYAVVATGGDTSSDTTIMTDTGPLTKEECEERQAQGQSEGQSEGQPETTPDSTTPAPSGSAAADPQGQL
jgi:hypothetical protein